MSAPAFVSADVRAEGLGRNAWIVNFTRATDAAPGCVVVPGDSEAEAIARAVHVACMGGFVSGPGEVGNVEAIDCGDRVAIVAQILVDRLALEGLTRDQVQILEVDGPAAPAPAVEAPKPQGFVVPPWARSRAVHGVIFVLAAPALAWAHHEQAIAELVSGLWVTVPAAVLALLHAIDGIRFWWRDGARVSYQGRAFRFYCSRALSGAGWHFCHDRAFGVRSFDLGSPWLRLELYSGSGE